jgi:peptidoglycan/LPS O-acetylase OafA/YrhL
MHATATKARQAAQTRAAGGTGAARLSSIQALRAIGALLVVWTHSIDAAQHFSLPRQARFFHLANFGACGVDIFFAISGFIVSLVAVRMVRRSEDGAGSTAHRLSAARQFFTRRFTRIFPLYWILTAVVILEGELGRYKVHWHSVQWLPTLLLFPSFHRPENAPMLSLGWSLMFEMYFYAVLALFVIWTPRRLVQNTAALLSGMAIAGIWIGIHRPLLVLWMNPMVLEFVFGCLIGLAYMRTTGVRTTAVRTVNAQTAPRSSRGWAALAGLGGMLLVITIFTGYGRGSNQDWIMAGYGAWPRVAVWGVPAALLVGGTIFWNPAMCSLPARVLVFLGDASYSIYLCTIPARSVVEHFWHTFGRFGADVGVVLGALFCVAAGVICYLLIERPMMRAFHNWYKPLPFRT